MPRADRIITMLVSVAVCAGAAHAQAVSGCAGSGQTIPDQGSTDVVVTVPAPAGSFASDVQVTIDLAHDWIGDLTITLSHGAQSATLMERIGVGGVYTFGCGGQDVDALFRDGAPVTPADLCTPGGPTPMIAGDVLPVDALSIFDGSPVGGDWTVTIADGSVFDAGVVNQVCISLVPVEPCAGDVDGDGATSLADFTALASNFGASGLPHGNGESLALGDIDDDGDVDLADFTVLSGDFGCAP